MSHHFHISSTLRMCSCCTGFFQCCCGLEFILFFRGCRTGINFISGVGSRGSRTSRWTWTTKIFYRFILCLKLTTNYSPSPLDVPSLPLPPPCPGFPDGPGGPGGPDGPGGPGGAAPDGGAGPPGGPGGPPGPGGPFGPGWWSSITWWTRWTWFWSTTARTRCARISIWSGWSRRSSTSRRSRWASWTSSASSSTSSS
uniref:Candidate secreted effector n=1 Tax=Meloidogyne incognita TaxID=6306 RepID=A0A914NJ70_MELIC